MRTSLDLFHVLYDDDDPVSKLLAYVTMIPLGFVVVSAAAVWFRRDFDSLFFFVGVLFDKVLNNVLKQVFKHARPVTGT